MSKPDGGPAFPRAGATTEIQPPYGFPGMTLRDYFAGQIIQGMMAGKSSNGWNEMARSAYKYADVMLAERDK